MKTIEEKAKAYDSIIEKANKMHSENCDACKACIEELIPEFAESEDERVRKALINVFATHKDYEMFFGVSVKDIRAWLDKQAERKTPQWMIDFLDGYRRKIGCSLDHDEARDVEGKILCIMQWLEKQGEQEKDILEDAILDGNEDGLIAETIRYKNEKQGEQKFEMKTAEESLGIDSDTYNKIVDECILGEQKPEENKGNIGGISANPEWSEEDKDFMYDTLSNLTELKDRYGEGYGNVGKCIDWLKSLKQILGGKV